MEDMHCILEELCASETNGILATIVNVEGSAYKKEGACMLFKEDHSQTGLLSAGCLEEDLAARIQRESGAKPQTTVYDMRSDDDFSWGEGSGCNGVITVFTEPVNSSVRADLKQLKSALDEGTYVIMVKCISSNSNLSFYVTEDGKEFGNWSSTAMPEEVKSLIKKAKKSQTKVGMRHLAVSDIAVYVHRFEPKPRLVVFGAGKDAIPLVSMASQTGFSVTITDWRPVLCSSFNFPTAEKLIVDFPDKVIPKLNLKPSDYVVVLTHNFQKDREILAFLADREFSYLGVLGSARRTKRVLGRKEIPGHITSPVGLSIDAEGPEEIAVSIVAELIKVRKERRITTTACVS